MLRRLLDELIVWGGIKPPLFFESLNFRHLKTENCRNYLLISEELYPQLNKGYNYDSSDKPDLQ